MVGSTRSGFRALVLAALVAALAACGVRSAPRGPEDSTYPLEYPSATADHILRDPTIKPVPPEGFPSRRGKRTNTEAPETPEPAPDWLPGAAPAPATGGVSGTVPGTAPAAASGTVAGTAPGAPAGILLKPLPTKVPPGSTYDTAPPATETIVR